MLYARNLRLLGLSSKIRKMGYAGAENSYANVKLRADG
jgi:hypothetical protein